MIEYFINKEIDTQINNWAVKFLLESAGYKANKSNTLNSKTKLYYGDDSSEINSLTQSLILKKQTNDPTKIYLVNEKSTIVNLTFDIVSATISLLTDKVNSNLSSEHFDNHHRLKGTSSKQYNKGTIKTPVINSYVELIKNSIQQKFSISPVAYYPKNYKSVVILSHDVDEPDRYAILKKYKGKTNHLTFQNKLTYCWLSLRKFIRKIIFGGTKSYWNFENIIATEHKYGFSSTFFFSSKTRYEKGSNFKLDNSYDIERKEFQELFSVLNSKGFEIGLHSSYNAKSNPSFFSKEKNKLEKIANREIIGNRHHFWNLGESEDKTLLAHHNSGFKYDSSLAFNDIPGYKRNTAFAFHPFNIENNSALSTLQIPNLFMDTNLVNSKNEEEILKRAISYINELTKAQGVASINWHVRMAYPTDKKLALYGRIYLKILEYLSQNESIWVTSFENYFQWHKERENSINAQK